MVKINFVKMLALLPLIFLFIPSMYLPAEIPVYDIVIGIGFVILLFSNKNISLIKQIISYRKYDFVRVLLLFIIWVFLSGIILIVSGKYNLIYALYAMLVLFLYNDILWFLYPSLVFPKIFSIKKLTRFLLIGIYIVCIYGLLVYFFDKLGIPILKWLHQIIVNRRAMFAEDIEVTLYSHRVLSVFEEPGYFGGFLCINLPIIYSVILSKYPLLKNKLLNAVIKKSYIPLVFITIIFIQSPIWFIFSLIATFAYFSKMLIKKYLKITVIFCLIFSFLFVAFQTSIRTIDLSGTFVSRINKTFNSFRNMEDFVTEECSLANRVISYYVRIKTFIKYPITGAGYKNTEYHAKPIFSNLNIPLTWESDRNLNSEEDKMGMNGAIFWDLLSDTGIVGILLFYSFLFLLIKRCKKISSVLPNSIEKTFMEGLWKTYIEIFCFSIYDIRPNFHYFWFLYGITISVMIFVQKSLVYTKKEKLLITDARKE